MSQGSSSFTIYFEDPFWVGVYQRQEAGGLSVCRVVFGSEPKDPAVYAFLLEGWHRLSFSRPVAAAERPLPHPNPKRVQRAARRQMEQQGPGTKAQQALARQREENKQAGRQRARAQRLEAEQQRFLLRQQKKKAKKRGH